MFQSSLILPFLFSYVCAQIQHRELLQQHAGHPGSQWEFELDLRSSWPPGWSGGCRNFEGRVLLEHKNHKDPLNQLSVPRCEMKLLCLSEQALLFMTHVYACVERRHQPLGGALCQHLLGHTMFLALLVTPVLELKKPSLSPCGDISSSGKSS